jgi:hypothetical protein
VTAQIGHDQIGCDLLRFFGATACGSEQLGDVSLEDGGLEGV